MSCSKYVTLRGEELPFPPKYSPSSYLPSYLPTALTTPGWRFGAIKTSKSKLPANTQLLPNLSFMPMNFYVNVDHYSSSHLMHLVSLGFLGLSAGRFMESLHIFNFFELCWLFFVPFSTDKIN